MSNLQTLLSLLGGLLLVASPAAAQDGKNKTDVMTMTAIPDGNYLVRLQIRGEGPMHRINLECKGGKLTCVNTDEPLLAEWKGRSMPIGNGVFMVQLAGGSERATQFWVFHADGAASVKEVPDRGEKQTAVPVKGTGLDTP